MDVLANLLSPLQRIVIEYRYCPAQDAAMKELLQSTHCVRTVLDDGECTSVRVHKLSEYSLDQRYAPFSAYPLKNRWALMLSIGTLADYIARCASNHRMEYGMQFVYPSLFRPAKKCSHLDCTCTSSRVICERVLVNMATGAIGTSPSPLRGIAPKPATSGNGTHSLGNDCTDEAIGKRHKHHRYAWEC
jgi:hypothetical protein